MSDLLAGAKEWDAILNVVGRGILDVNSILLILRKKKPHKSDILEVSHSSEDYADIQHLTQEIENCFRVGSTTAALWLQTIGERHAETVRHIAGLQQNMRLNEMELSQAHEYMSSVRERIVQITGTMNSTRSALDTSRRNLSEARDALHRRRNEQTATWIGACVAFVIFPPAGLALAGLTLTALQNAVENQDSAVDALSRQLSSDEEALRAQTKSLKSEEDECERLEYEKEGLRRQNVELAQNAETFKRNSEILIAIEMKINDCLHAVNSARSNSAAMLDLISIRNIAVSVKGLITSLQVPDDLFSDSLAKFDDEGLTKLEAYIEHFNKPRGLLYV